MDPWSYAGVTIWMEALCPAEDTIYCFHRQVELPIQSSTHPHTPRRWCKKALLLSQKQRHLHVFGAEWSVHKMVGRDWQILSFYLLLSPFSISEKMAMLKIYKWIWVHSLHLKQKPHVLFVMHVFIIYIISLRYNVHFILNETIPYLLTLHEIIHTSECTFKTVWKIATRKMTWIRCPTPVTGFGFWWQTSLSF